MTTTTTPRRLASLAALAALSLSCKGPAAADTTTTAHKEAPEQSGSEAPVSVRIIAFNDLHGNLERPSSGFRLGQERVDAGGLDVMATYLRELRREHPNTAFVCAGDLIGASPLISALFHDEPTIEAMNALKLDVLAVGNHEFDDGLEELKRLAAGGCHPEHGCQGKDAFDGAQFPFLAANVIVDETGETLFPGSLVKTYEGVKVGFIGLTLRGTDKAVSPSAIQGISFRDEAETINAEVKALQAEGVEAIVVVMHEGGWQGQEDGDVNGCNDLQGPILEINARVDPAVDVIVAGHTHRYFNCLINGRLLTSAKDYGRMLTSIDLTLDPASGEVLSKQATNVVLAREGVAIDEAMGEHIKRYRDQVAPLASAQIGTLKEDIVRGADELGNSPMGQLVAEAQWHATKSEERGGADFALMNPGGVRNDLLVDADDPSLSGVITYEALHSVQPFGNTLTVLEMTGAQIEELLESQWREDGGVTLLQPSSSLTYRYNQTEGDRIDPREVFIASEPLDRGRTYRVTVNSFLASGGDGFEIFTEANVVAGGPTDLDVFAEYIRHNSPIEAPKGLRIAPK